MDAHSVLFNSVPVDSGKRVSWDFGDGAHEEGAIVSHQFLSAGIYKVCMAYPDQSSTPVICKNISTSDYNGCNANFHTEITEVKDALNLSTISVEWTDENGVVYSTAKVSGNTANAFRIIESSDYKLNDNGKPTRYLKVKFDAQLSDGAKLIQMKNMEAVVAVAMPE